jgi:transposase
MDRYIGADAHQASVTFCVLDATGKVVRQDVVETRGRPLVDYVKGISGRLHLCLEEGEWCNWLHEILSGHVAELVVYRPQWRPGPKSDAIDAHGLAEKLRTGKIERPVYKGKAFRELREAARIYTKITRDAARVKNRIRSVYRSRGLAGLGPEVFDPRKRDRVEKLLPGFLRGPIQLLGAELDFLGELKARAEERMLTASHRHRIARVLESAPGMGAVRVAQMIPIVMTPYRFRTKRQFWSYCGFGIVTRSSSDWVRQNGQWSKAPVIQTRGLSFHHNRTLKMIFKGAATTVIAHCGPNPLREDYDRLLDNGTKPNLAKLTIARKVSAIVLAMWKTGVRYDPERRKVLTTP